MVAKRIAALWRGALAAPGPLPRRLGAFAVAALPLALRRLALRVAALPVPRWLRSLAQGLQHLLRALAPVVALVLAALLGLWLLGHLQAWALSSGFISPPPVGGWVF